MMDIAEAARDVFSYFLSIFSTYGRDDLINAFFELFGGFMVFNHCRVLYEQKVVSGISLLSVAFFTLWGFWNIYYYPSLNQQLSFYCGILVAVANMTYLSMLMHYRGVITFRLRE